MLNFSDKKSARTVFGIGVFTAAGICVLLRVVSTLFFFDTDIGYYQSGKVFPILSYITPIAATVAALVLCLIPKLGLTAPSAHNPVYTRICAIVPALGFAAFSVIYILSLIEYRELQSDIPFSFILCALTSLIACVFFVLKALGKRNEVLTAVCGMLTVIWLVLALAQSYFDTFMTMNSPIKTVFEFACLAAMLFVLCEARMGIDKRRTQLHLFASAAAVIFPTLSAIPSLFGFALDLMPQSYNLIYYDAVLLSVSVFASARLVNLTLGKEHTELTDVPAEELTEQAEAADEEQEEDI